MNRNTQTYPVSIPSVALAVMATLLAERRAVAAGNHHVDGYWSNFGLEPSPRASATPRDMYPISCQYYAIIDRLSRGEAP